MTTESADTRTRILMAAGELFYSEGIERCSVEQIAAAAGLSKRALYYHFRSKDDIIGEWLDDLDQVVRARYREWLHAVPGSVETRLRHMFVMLAQAARNPRWKGCGFVRAANELAGLPGHPGVVAAKRHRVRFEGWLAEELRAEGIPAPERTARRILLLLDGAIAQALIHHDPTYLEEAGEAASEIVAASSHPCSAVHDVAATVRT